MLRKVKRFWQRCWSGVSRAIEPETKTAQTPLRVPPISTGTTGPESGIPPYWPAPMELTASSILPPPLPVAATGVPETSSSDIPSALDSRDAPHRDGDIIQFPGNGARRYMLAARTASVRALNPPKSIAPPRGRAVSKTTPRPMRENHQKTVSMLTPRRSIGGPRVLRPERTSAIIIPMPQTNEAKARHGTGSRPQRAA